MILETAKNRICMHQIVEKKQDEMSVEGDMIVSDVKPDILRIISTNGIVCVYKKEVTDGKIRIDGTINTYIIYLADDENSKIRTLNTVLDFTYVTDIDKCKMGMTFNEEIKLMGIECKILNERKINIRADLSISGILYSDENIDIISDMNDVEDIQILNSSRQVNSLIGSGNTKVYAKEILKVDETDNLAEIMRVNTIIINKNIKISYNKVLAKADFKVDVMYLTEDNRICKTSIEIPVMGFIDIENISDDGKCDTNYKLKNLIIKPDNTDEHSIYIEAEIEISCFAYEEKNINLIEDMYSIYSNLQFNQRKIESIIEKQDIVEICNINKQISLPEIGGNQLYNIEVFPEINSCKIKKSNVKYDAELKLQLLFNTNIGIESKNITVPFEFEINSDNINEGDDLKTTLDITKDNFIVTSDGNIEMDLNIEFSVTIFAKEDLNIIDDVSVEESRENNIYSMVIYFVKKGDTLWKIAKKFRSTIEDISRVNQIDDINKIYPGQQLYIPKYIKKNIA